MQLTSPSELSSGFATVDFEGLSGPLSTQIPGLTFLSSETSVVDPATIGNSPDIPLSAATSGTAAGFGTGSEITFDPPVTEVGMFVSPSFITLTGTTVFNDFSLVAFDSLGNEIGSVTVPVLESTGDQVDIENFSPVFLGLKSGTFISSVRVDAEFPQVPGGSTFFFDDLSILPVLPNGIWEGGAGGVWSDRFNWSNDALPTGSDNIVIDGNVIVTLDIPFTLTTGTLTIQNGSELVIGTGGTIDNLGGTINNSGTITNSSSGGFGIRNQGTINNFGIINNSGGSLSNFGGTINNSGIITISNTSFAFGISNGNGATLNNFATGIITLFSDGSIFNGATINNSGTINISNFGSTINNFGTINNNAGGTITITDNSSIDNDTTTSAALSTTSAASATREPSTTSASSTTPTPSPTSAAPSITMEQ